MDWLYESIYKAAVVGFWLGVIIAIYKIVAKLFAKNNEANNKSKNEEITQPIEFREIEILEKTEKNANASVQVEDSSIVNLLIGAVAVVCVIVLGITVLDKLGKWLY